MFYFYNFCNTFKLQWSRKTEAIVAKLENAEKNVANKDTINEDVALVFGNNSSWEHLLSPAPIGIAILGDLMCFAATMKDFGIDANVSPEHEFKHIKYPKSFRASLVQVSHLGYKAFKAAHVNMDKI